MTAASKRLVWTSLAILLAGVFYECHLLARDSARLIALRMEVGQLEPQLAQKKQARQAIEHELAASTQDLAALQATEAAATTGREADLRTWLRKTAQLEELFARQPDQAIPELALLSPLDWLGAGHEADLDSALGVRRTLSDVRDRAKWELQPLLSDALNKFTQAHGGLLPATVSELAPYLDGSVNPAILAEYEMKAGGNIHDLPPGHAVISDAAPVDRELDHRILISAEGTAVRPWSQAPLDDAVSSAQDAYAKGHGGPPPENPDPALIAPYIPSPVLREVYQGLAGFVQAHPGRRNPENASELMPYLATPEARALAETLWPKRN